MKKNIFGLFLFFVFLFSSAEAQNLFSKHERTLTLPDGYVCYRTAGKIKIDGKLKEESWQNAGKTTSFVDISGEGFAKLFTILTLKCCGMMIISM